MMKLDLKEKLGCTLYKSLYKIKIHEIYLIYYVDYMNIVTT